MTSLKIVIVVVGVAVFENVSALSGEERNSIRAGLRPFIAECSKQFGVSEEKLKEAKESGSIGSINPCLMGCVFKKANLINDNGLFDPAKAEEITKKFLTDEEDQAKTLNIIKICSSVNDQEISGGVEGCERAKLLFDCLIPFKGEFVKSR